MTAEVPLQVLIADDDDLLRDVLVEVLEDDGRFEVVGSVGSADAAIEAACRKRPTVALVDAKMAGAAGQHIVSELRSLCPETRVVALSSYDDRSTIVDMFRSGAVSYLVKGEATNADITTTLVRVAGGEFALPASIGDQLLEELSVHLTQAHRNETQRSEAERRVRSVLSSGPLRMVYQPIIDLRDERRVGAEALARFDVEPRQGPDRWFADAEAVGLGTELEVLAVRSAIDAVEYLAEDTYLSLNVSPVTAGDAAFQALVLGARPGATVMEITEHAQIDDYDAFSRAIEPLRTAGVLLAVDDAGAGFASLRHIVLLAPDMIKLDLSLTRGIDEDRTRRAMARALISFAGETGITIVAEGIETDAELDTLRDLGASTGQGYLLGRPGPLEEL